MCQEFNNSSPSKEQYRNARLTKAKLRTFLTQRYGPMIADKLVLLFDFNTPLDFIAYQGQIEALLKSKELLKLATFDVYDLNADNKVSETDLFRLLRYFDVTEGIAPTFERHIVKDFITLIQFLRAKREAKDLVKLENAKK